VDSPNCDWVVSEEILAEYQDVLSRKKFKLTDEVRKEWLDVIDLVTTLVDVQVTIDFARDRKDEKFLACAVAAEADFLITGDADFNQAQNLVNTTIVSVSMFKRLVCDFRG
jgi:putative PIN family toxin of toxin-antitoxin system